MNQTELAKKIGCDPSYISHIVNGRRNPSWQLAKKIAKALKTLPEFWLNGESSPEERRKALESHRQQSPSSDKVTVPSA